MLFRSGDDVLPVQCAVVDLVAQHGTLHPRLVVLDTEDSAIWIGGELSMANEQMDLRAVVSPKDFALLSLRTPLRMQGTFSAPGATYELQLRGRHIHLRSLSQYRVHRIVPCQRVRMSCLWEYFAP